MRVSVTGAAQSNTKTTTNNNSGNPKTLYSATSTTTTDNSNFLRNPTAHHTINNSTITTTLCYEPTSVLDLQRSPSPAAAPPPTISSVPDALSATTAAANPTVDLDNLEGWDSILSELGLNDDSNPNPKFVSQFNDPQHLPDFPHSQPFDHNPHHASSLITADFADPFPYTPNFPPHDQPLDEIKGYGLDFIDDLIRAAQSFESGDSHHAQLILARLNQRLRSPVGKPLHRAAFYFKEALNQLLTGSANRPVRLNSYEIVQTIRAYKAFSGISPIPLFSTFTANQAILEAIDGSNFVHIIDFDIGFGGHWASLMREIVDKSPAGSGADPVKSSNSIVLRITAIVPEEFGVESKLVRENLTQFARDLNITFHLEFILIQSFEILSFKAVKFIQGEKVAVHLSPTTFQRLGSRSNVSRFLGDLRSVAAHVVVLVDREVGMDTGIASFSLNFVAGLEFYTAMLESLDAAVASGGGSEWGRRIEMYLIRPRIVEAVEATAGRRGAVAPSWREVFLGAGIKAVGFSQFADFQAECLLRRAQVAGFHVAKRQGEMLLCWHDRPIVATSAWRC
nr:GRAS transcription factor 3 [Rheum palmatum]